jgi:CBS domain-containing protein
MTPTVSPDTVRAAIAAAVDVPAMAAAAAGIRGLACTALAAGEGALAVARLITELNDRVTEQLVRGAAAACGLDLGRACWIAFGSQGRREQTPVTDQDNGWVIDDADPPGERARWLELGQRVNRALDACGYPLCRGHVMAGEPDCCLSLAQWCARFDHWIEHGSPQDLLNASIYFDLRALVGRHDLVAAMQQHIHARAAALPRFAKQLAENVLRNAVPLNWHGGVRTVMHDGRPSFDLKLHGTMLFADAARLYALAQGVSHSGTDERLEAVAQALHVPADEMRAWRDGFEAMLGLRLAAHCRRSAGAHGSANTVAIDELDAGQLDRLGRALRAARTLQQRIELDYRR